MYGIGEGRDGETTRCGDIGACENSMVATRARWRVGSSLICSSDMSIRSESGENRDKRGKRYCWRGDKTARTKSTVLFVEISDSSL